MKHHLKLWLRSGWARLLYHSGLHRVVSRRMPRRLLILAGHCVAAGSNDGLPADMKISPEKLSEMLRVLGRDHRLCTVGEGVRALQEGDTGPSLVALSMDDGYRDNRQVLLPLLQSLGARATVYLESRPLDERRVNWSHKYFWLLRGLDPESLGRQLIGASEHEGLSEDLRRALEEGGDLAYRIKRLLKYHAAAEARDAALDRLFAERGGDEAALCEELYLTWDEARELAAGGVELGGHTVTHHVLSTLSADAAGREIGEGRVALERELGEGSVVSFAYPFGRRWDFDEGAIEGVRRAGFASAVTTHAGVNTKASDPYRLARWMVDEGTPLHLLVAEACGGFELLRRFGLDLSE